MDIEQGCPAEEDVFLHRNAHVCPVVMIRFPATSTGVPRLSGKPTFPIESAIAHERLT